MENINCNVVDRKLDSIESNRTAYENKKIKFTAVTKERLNDLFRKIAVNDENIKQPQEDNSVVEDKQTFIDGVEINNVKDVVKDGSIEESHVVEPNHPIKLYEDDKDNVAVHGMIAYPEEDIDVSKVKAEEIAAEVEQNFHNQENEVKEDSVSVSDSKFDELVSNVGNVDMEKNSDLEENKDVSFELENKENSDVNNDFEGFSFDIPSNGIEENSIDSKEKSNENDFEGTINDSAFDQNVKEVVSDFKTVEPVSEDSFYNIMEVTDLDQLRQALRQEKERKDALTKQLAEEQIAAEEANKDLQKAEEAKIVVLNQYKESIERFRRANKELKSQSDKLTEETNATNSEIRATMDYVSSLNEMMSEIVGNEAVSESKEVGKAV